MFVAEKAYICNMRRWCIKILLIAVLSLVSVFLYEVLWVLVDLDVRRDFINNGIPLDELRELVQVVRDRINPPQPRVRLTLACEGEMRVVQVREIGCIMSENGGVTIVMENGDKIATQMLVRKLESQLAGTNFVRVSRRAFVNVDKITCLLRADKSTLAVKVAGWADPIAVSRNYIAYIRKIFDC